MNIYSRGQLYEQLISIYGGHFNCPRIQSLARAFAMKALSRPQDILPRHELGILCCTRWLPHNAPDAGEKELREQHLRGT